MICWISHRRFPSGRFLLVDRDGVINRNRPDYVKNRSEFTFYPDALSALRWLHAHDVHVIVISNQSALHRGLMPWDAFFDLHHHMIREISASGGRIDAAFYCPHRPDEGCSCRKPAPGMILAAASLCGFPTAATPFVGDNLTDAAAAENAGCLPVLLRRTLDPVEAPSYVPVYNTLFDAVRELFDGRKIDSVPTR